MFFFDKYHCFFSYGPLNTSYKSVITNLINGIFPTPFISMCFTYHNWYFGPYLLVQPSFFLNPCAVGKWGFYTVLINKNRDVMRIFYGSISSLVRIKHLHSIVPIICGLIPFIRHGFDQGFFNMNRGKGLYANLDHMCYLEAQCVYIYTYIYIYR